MWFICLYICLLFSEILPESYTQRFNLERIVGGREVTIDNFPYQLSIRRNNRYICGGALIGEKYGLSAAHCFKDQGLYSARAGSTWRDSGGVVKEIKTVFLHPERTIDLYQYDIAILEFAKPFHFSDTIRPIKLPEKADAIVSGAIGVISGYGDVFHAENSGSRVLRAAQISIENLEWCRNHYEQYGIRFSRMVFCAGLPQGGKDSCQGDSGGPLVIGDTLYGLVSFGLDCGDPAFPGVYTNVVACRDFIRVNTGL